MASPTDSGSQRSASLGRIALTDRTVRALKPPSTGRLDVWDEDNPGFALRCWFTLTALSSMQSYKFRSIHYYWNTNSHLFTNSSLTQ
jgi:hypothetical protein